MYEIEYGEGVTESLKELPVFEQRRILDAVDEQLTHEPVRQTKNKKILAGLVAPWYHEEPMWQLRVGSYRVFYDVDEASRRVFVRAIRHKPPHLRTEEIL